jgi:hypothetical protein
MKIKNPTLKKNIKKIKKIMKNNEKNKIQSKIIIIIKI